MFKNIFLSGFAFLFLLLPGCTNYNEEELYGTTQPEVCNITSATFTADVKPILQRECNSCHNTSFAADGIILDTYDGVKKVTIDKNRLFPAINHEPGFIPMPLGGNKLPACDIAKIKKWIELGALNN